MAAPNLMPVAPPPSAPTRTARRPLLGIVAAGLLALLLTALASLGVWQEERRRWQTGFEGLAGESAAMLRLTLERHRYIAHSIGAFLLEQPTADQASFERFVSAALEAHPELEVIGYHPRVPHEQRQEVVERIRAAGQPDFDFLELSTQYQFAAAPERAEYFPTLLIASQPRENYRQALGYTPTRDGSLRWRQLQQARASGEAVITERTQLVGGQLTTVGLMLWEPVFTGPAHTGELLGFVSLSFRVQEIGMALFMHSPFAREHLLAHAFDVTDPARARLLYSDSLPAADTAALLSSELTPDSLRHDLYAEHMLDIGGRRWAILFVPSESFKAVIRSTQPLLIAVIGLALTALLVVYLRSLAMRTASIEQQVEERTRAWRNVNQKLTASLAKRKQTQQRLKLALRERETALEAQREADVLFHTAFEHAAGPAAIILPDGRFLETNAAFSRLVGFSRTDLSLMTMHELTHPADRDVTPKQVERVLHGEQNGFRIEKRYIHKDGSIIWIEAQSAAVRDAEGQPRFFVAHVLDVTRTRRDQRQLKLLSRQQDWILNTTKEPIIGLDPRGYATFVNDAACALLGYSREAMLGGSLHSLIHHSHGDGRPFPAEACPILAALACAKPREVQKDIFWHRDGSTISTDYTVTPMFESGQVAGAVVVLRQRETADVKSPGPTAAPVMAGF